MLATLEKRDWICAAVLVIAAFVPYVPAVVLGLTLDPIHYGGSLDTHQIRGHILGGPWLDPNTGFTVQALGKLSADDWLHGRVPWWNPYTGAGVPLAAEMQTLSFFLPFVLLLHFAYGAIFLKIALQIVAALATYALLRELGLVRVACFCGAVLYEFHGSLAWFAHAPIAPAPFLPLLLLGIERVRVSARERRRGGWVLLGVALAYSLYAGFPEVAYLDGLLALCWTLVRFATAGESRGRFAAKVVAGGAAGVLMALPIVVPFLEYQHLSAIQHTLPPDSGRNVSVFAALLMPYIFGPISAYSEPSGHLQDLWGGGGGYLDGTLLLLACVGLFSGRRDRGLRIVLAVWMAVFLLRIMALLHIGYLLDLIPGMNVLAVERYCETSWSMAAVVLGAYGLDQWRRGWLMSRRAILALVIGFVGLELLAVWLGRQISASLWHESDVRHYGTWFWGSTGWALLMTIAISVSWLRRSGRRMSVAMAALVTLNAAALFAIPTLSGYRYVETDYGLVRFLQEHAAFDRFYTFGPFAPNYGAYFGVASINHNAVPIPASWMRYVHTQLDPAVADPIFVGYTPGPMEDRYRALCTNRANFEELGVRYVVTPRGVNPFAEESGADQPSRVYRGLVADVFQLPGPSRYFATEGGACRVTNVARERVSAWCDTPAVLIRKELFYPGWRATVNGRGVPVEARSIFQSVSLPRGDSTVVFSYLPSHWGWLCAAAVLGLALLLAGARQSAIES
ncbi:MAG TPA: hypothetical protein VKX25_12680 [Bryobacteraceae bacterium]|jgi:hypothetical protein|nr:hypothetical protein [Bryobacteraceae bacterium]